MMWGSAKISSRELWNNENNACLAVMKPHNLLP